MNDSPGNMPNALGNVWVGNTQNCIVDWPNWKQIPVVPYVPVPVTYHFTPNRLSDDDVERVAKRVAELIKEKL